MPRKRRKLLTRIRHRFIDWKNRRGKPKGGRLGYDILAAQIVATTKNDRKNKGFES